MSSKPATAMPQPSDDDDRDGVARESEEERLRRLVAQIDHRAKNMLAVVQATARLMAKDDGDRSFAKRFNARIASLAASHDLFVRSAWKGVDLGELVRMQLSRSRRLVGTRIVLDGPTLSVTADAAQSLGMAFFELAANAREHGALRTDEGSVRIEWRLTGAAPRLEIRWQEDGAAPGDAESAGFGSMIVDDMMRSTFGADIELDFADDGLRWRFVADAARLLQE